MNNKIKFSKFDDLAYQLTNLEVSPLYEYRKANDYKPVLGEGNLNARIMFIGEAPGENEGKTGRPFVGAAGKLLTGMLQEAGINREDVFITSVVHDRPPNNRKPTKKEIEIYSQFLFELINLIKPEIIVTMGNISTETIFSKYFSNMKNMPINVVHGQEFTTTEGIKIVPIYHPAYLLYQATKKAEFKIDLQKIAAL